MYGDGKLLAGSPAMAFGGKAHRLKADIRGVKVIELVARGSGSGSASGSAPPAVATWGDVQLVRDGDAGH